MPSFGFSNAKHDFRPRSRGDISAALTSSKALVAIAPQSPRPPEMLSGVSVDGDVSLTSNDIAIHELLISKAYESDPEMRAPQYEIPMSECIRFCGADARQHDVVTALSKMEQIRLTFRGGDGRTYEGVQMLTAWRVLSETTSLVGYSFPEPIRALMRRMPRYGYIELAAVGQGSMRSRYSQTLYKILADEVSQRPWSEDVDNTFTLSYSPEAFADLVGMPKPQSGLLGTLRDRVMRHISDDFSGVKKFDLDVAYDGKPAPARGRGQSVQAIELTVKVHPDTYHVVRGKIKADAGIGAPDAPKYRIDSVFWVKVARKFEKLVLVNFMAHRAWLVVLKEALDDKALTPGYETRRYRGRRLLDAIDADGVKAAAWGFFAEEAELGAEVCGSKHVQRLLQDADRDRLKRFMKSKKEKKAVGRPRSGMAENRISKLTKSAPKTTPDNVDDGFVRFEEANVIVVDIDDAFNQHDVDNQIWGRVQAYDWTGDRKVRMHVKFRTTAGVYDRFEVDIKPYDLAEFGNFMKTISEFTDGEATFRRIK